jgi:hypothetical protein
MGSFVCFALVKLLLFYFCIFVVAIHAQWFNWFQFVLRYIHHAYVTTRARTILGHATRTYMHILCYVCYVVVWLCRCWLLCMYFDFFFSSIMKINNHILSFRLTMNDKYSIVVIVCCRASIAWCRMNNYGW